MFNSANRNVWASNSLLWAQYVLLYHIDKYEHKIFLNHIAHTISSLQSVTVYCKGFENAKKPWWAIAPDLMFFTPVDNCYGNC